MRTKVSKEEFISNVSNKIERREELINFYKNTFLPTLQKFDGKVYNKRFITALQSGCNDCMIVRNMENQHIVVEHRKDKFSYTEHEDLYIRVLMRENRLSYEDTIADNLGEKWLNGFINTTNELRSCIDNYDVYIGLSNEVQQIIDKYSETPFEFRHNVSFDKLYYLS